MLRGSEGKHAYAFFDDIGLSEGALMLVNIVDIFVNENNIELFISYSLENQLASIKEPNVLRFDFNQDNSNPTHFVIYEVFENDEASISHKKSQHYQKWRDSVQEFMQEERHTTHYTMLAPDVIGSDSYNSCRA